eukprot:gb/GEZN01004384.1/.p1 GENE.gb/GEZN01004384.1/~~gb/GEZN01004384.1/.p1  ORF type:complete len:516 (-),score=42.82 gb/GEZN01004384.1/:369-1916(-)
MQAPTPVKHRSAGAQNPHKLSKQPSCEMSNNEALASELSSTSRRRSTPSTPSPHGQSQSIVYSKELEDSKQATARSRKLRLDLDLDLSHFHLQQGGGSRSGEQTVINDELPFQLQDAQRVEQQSLVHVQGLGVQARTMTRGCPDKNDSEPRRKTFVGGIPWLTTDEELRMYFTTYGTVVDATIVRDLETGASRGYGFVTFKEPEAAVAAAQAQHILNGRNMDCKIAAPTVSRKGGEHVRKMFVGRLSRQTTSSMLSDHFRKYGELLNAVVMVDRTSGRSRGFGFVTFVDAQSMAKVFKEPQVIQSRVVECHKALSGQQIQREHERKFNFLRTGGTLMFNIPKRNSRHRQAHVRRGFQQQRYQESHGGDAYSAVQQQDNQQSFTNLNPMHGSSDGTGVYFSNTMYSPPANKTTLVPISGDEWLGAPAPLLSQPHFQQFCNSPCQPSQNPFGYSPAYQPDINMQSNLVIASSLAPSNSPAIDMCYDNLQTARVPMNNVNVDMMNPLHHIVYNGWGQY